MSLFPTLYAVFPVCLTNDEIWGFKSNGLVIQFTKLNTASAVIGKFERFLNLNSSPVVLNMPFFKQMPVGNLKYSKTDYMRTDLIKSVSMAFDASLLIPPRQETFVPNQEKSVSLNSLLFSFTDGEDNYIIDPKGNCFTENYVNSIVGNQFCWVIGDVKGLTGTLFKKYVSCQINSKQFFDMFRKDDSDVLQMKLQNIDSISSFVESRPYLVSILDPFYFSKSLKKGSEKENTNESIGQFISKPLAYVKSDFKMSSSDEELGKFKHEVIKANELLLDRSLAFVDRITSKTKSDVLMFVKEKQNSITAIQFDPEIKIKEITELLMEVSKELNYDQLKELDIDSISKTRINDTKSDIELSEIALRSLLTYRERRSQIGFNGPIFNDREALEKEKSQFTKLTTLSFGKRIEPIQLELTKSEEMKLNTELLHDYKKHRSYLPLTQKLNFITSEIKLVFAKRKAVPYIVLKSYLQEILFFEIQDILLVQAIEQLGPNIRLSSDGTVRTSGNVVN